MATEQGSLAADRVLNPQLLAANNMLFGTTNLLVLNLPEGWLLRNGYQRPEVDARRLVGEVNWATLAAAHYLLGGTGRKTALDLWVRVMPRAPKGDLTAARTLTVQGHEASYTITTDKKGDRHLLLRWTCPETLRTLELEARDVEEAQTQESLERLASALSECRCH